MFRKTWSLQKGFTLVEILVVIVIVGILAAVLFPSMGGFSNTSQVGVVESDLRLIKNNIQDHYIDSPDEPITTARLKEYLGYSATMISAPGVEPAEFLLEKKDPWANPYKLIVGNGPELFLLFQSYGPDEKDSLGANGIDGNIGDDTVILHLPEV